MGLELFYLAFEDLTSSRVLGPAGAGPIPWGAIHGYCEALGAIGEQREDLFYHVARLDRCYLEWLDRKRQADLKKQPTKGRRS